MFSKIGGWITGFSARSSLILGTAILFLLAIFVTLNVVLRTANAPTFGFHEIILLITAAFVLIGAAYTEKRKGHIMLDFLISRVSPKTREVLNCLASFLALGFAIVFTWRLVVYTHSLQVTGAFYLAMVPLPYWPAYTVACLGFIFFAIMLIARFIQSIKQNIENFRQSPR